MIINQVADYISFEEINYKSCSEEKKFQDQIDLVIYILVVKNSPNCSGKIEQIQSSKINRVKSTRLTFA